MSKYCTKNKYTPSFNGYCSPTSVYLFKCMVFFHLVVNKKVELILLSTTLVVQAVFYITEMVLKVWIDSTMVVHENLQNEQVM